MKKVAIIGKQQPMIIRKRIKEYLIARGYEADILDMNTRNVLDWTDEMKGYSAIISSGEKFPAEVFERLSETLELVSRYGVGTDEIDKVAASKHGVAVCNAAGTLSVAVAECAIGLILCLLRHLPSADREVRAGDWSRFFESKLGSQIEGKTVGLIGFGDIAQAIARMLKGFNCRIIAYDLFWNKKIADELGVEYADIDVIRRESDILSLNVPSTPETSNMVNREFLKSMKNTAILINTARGKLVDEEALIEALTTGEIAAAGLDVYNPEPPLDSNPLLKLPNVMLLPHIGAGTIECHERAGMMSAKNVADFFDGKPVPTILNKDYKKASTDL